MAYCGPKGIALSAFLDWPQEDQDAALEWAAYENRRCGRCGSHPAEGTNHVHVDLCQGCQRLDAVREDVKDPGLHAHLVGGRNAECERCTREREANVKGTS